MKVTFDSKRQPVVIEIKIKVKKPCYIHVCIQDAKKPYTNYINGTQHIRKPIETLRLNMPQSPEVALVKVFNKENGDLPNGQDKSFVCQFSNEPLNPKFVKKDFDNPIILQFVSFARKFSERAGIVSASVSNGNPSVYTSPDGQFIVEYLDVIKDQNGKNLTTPCRTNTSNGIIQVSKYHFQQYTIAGRMALLLHEFCHFYINDNKKDEIEADLNALMIYLGLGYPKSEAKQVFINVFKNKDNGLNRGRYETLKKFIDEFDTMEFQKINA